MVNLAMFRIRIRCYYFFLVHVLPTVIISLIVFHRRQQFCLSVFLWHPNPKPWWELYISLPFTCCIHCQILLLSFLFAAFFSPSTAALVFTWMTLPVSSPSVPFLQLPLFKGFFWSGGISILTLKSHMDSHSQKNRFYNCCPYQVFKLSYHSTCLTFTFLGFQNSLVDNSFKFSFNQTYSFKGH